MAKDSSVPRFSYRKILKASRKKGIQLDPTNDSKVSKHYLKFLSICNNPKILSTVLKTAPDSAIKRICDAALNAADGEIPIDEEKKKLFARKRNVFSHLIDPKIPIKRKRKYISNQKGGALPIIPLLLSTVLGTIGSRLFKN